MEVMQEQYKDTIFRRLLGKIPNDWSIKEISDFTKFSQGVQVNVELQFSSPSNELIRFIRIVDYTQNTDDIRYISKSYNKYIVNENDIVMIRYGTPGVIGRNIKGVIANNMFKISIDNSLATNDYFEYFFKQKHIQEYLLMGSGSSTMPALNFSYLKKFQIALPPLPEQQKIAAILSTVDEQINTTDKIIEKSKELKKGLMQKLFSEGIGHTEFKDTKIGRIPKEWEVVKIKEVCSIEYGKDQKKVENPDGKYGIYGTGGLMNYSDEFLYNKPSVLIGRKGTIDKPRYIDIPFWTVDTLFYTKIFDDFDVKWFYYRCVRIPWRTLNEATGVPSLNRNNIYSFKNVIFENLSYPKNKDKILYGGINLINSNVTIIDTEIRNSNSEDAINIISSQSYIKNLKLNNISADAIDIDFGKMVFENITCEKILNDCLDVSGGVVEGRYLKTKDIMDKGLSFGENSNGNISNSTFINNKLAIAVKDGSQLSLSEFNFKENKYDIAVFNKKKEYGSSILSLDKFKDISDLKILLGSNNKILPDTNKNVIEVKNSYINNLFY